MQGESNNLRLLHIPLHGFSIMLLNGLVAGVHSSAAATQYSVDIVRKKGRDLEPQ